jgi:hypothetical protein
VAFLGGGVAFGLHARKVDRDLRALRCSSVGCPEDQAFERKADQVEREALIANIGFAAAAAAAIAAVLLFTFEGREVAVAPTSGGATVSLAGSF